MDAAAGCDLGDGDVGEADSFLGPPAPNFQVIATILHFVSEAMNLCPAQEEDKKSANDAHRKQAWGRILSQAPIERGRRRYTRNQCSGTEPDPALEQDGVLERNNLHDGPSLPASEILGKLGRFTQPPAPPPAAPAR